MINGDFIERAQAVNNTLVLTPENLLHVARICIGVDGIPLALELAAAHARGFFDIVVGQSSQGQDGGDCPFRWSYKVRPSRVTTEAM